jgi:hypothetical protein
VIDNLDVEDGNIPPALNALALFENTLSRRYQALGLTPLASTRIKMLTDARSWEARALTGEVDVEETN